MMSLSTLNSSTNQTDMSYGQLKFKLVNTGFKANESKKKAKLADTAPEQSHSGAEDYSGSRGSSRSPSPSAKKRRTGGKHQMAACCACKKKRKKCDGKYPICSGCQASKTACTVFDATTGRVIPRDYMQSLEEKVKQLESVLLGNKDGTAHEKSQTIESEDDQTTQSARALLTINQERIRENRDMGQKKVNNANVNNAEANIGDSNIETSYNAANYNGANDYEDHEIESNDNEINNIETNDIDTNDSVTNNIATSDLEAENSERSRSCSPSKNKDLAMEVGYITLGAAAENRYIGDSSAYSIGKAITNSIHYYKRDEQKAVPPTTSLKDNVLPEPPVPQFSRPPVSVAKTYLEAYRTIAQCQYPFLDWDYVKTAFGHVMSDEKGRRSLEDLFFIYMIFAIGSQLTGYQRQYSSNAYTKIYYNKAMESIEPLVETTTIKTVQAYLIIAMFSQKMPDGSSAWQTTGLAIRTAVTLGLHREPYYRNNEKQKRERGSEKNERLRKRRELRYRIFWSAYGMERINGIVLGRPFGISDIDIDVSLPSETPGTAVACHVIRLRRIQSSICTFVYKPVQVMDKPEEIDATRVQIVLELNNWMSTFPAKAQPASIFETTNWSSISYHNSMLLLLRPVLLEVSKLKNQSGPRLLEWFKVFTQSASAICMNYKDLHAKGKLGYTWLAMHCVFVAGLSFLYCLWIDHSVKVLQWKRRGLIYDTISGCSSILYVLAERFTSASVFRDTFDRIANTVLIKIEEQEKGKRKKQKRNSGAAMNNFYGSNLLLGALDEESIGIDQYLSYGTEPSRAAGVRENAASSSNRFNLSSLLNPSKTARGDGAKSGEGVFAGNHSNEIQEGHGTGSKDYDFDMSLWEFLDNTGDKFLRDIYYDMKRTFNFC